MKSSASEWKSFQSLEKSIYCQNSRPGWAARTAEPFQIEKLTTLPVPHVGFLCYLDSDEILL